MNYFVSINNTSFWRWQAELLVESFRMLKLQDHVVLGVCNNDTPQPNTHLDFLKRHERKFAHEPCQQTEESAKSDALRVLYSIIMAMETRQISQPFAMLPPHSVIRAPLPTIEDHIVFHVDDHPSSLRDDIAAEIKQIEIDRNAGSSMWLPLGDTVIFNNVEVSFFHRAFQRAVALIHDHQNRIDILRAALILTIYEYMGTYHVRGTQFETTLLHNTVGHVINYRHGLPPVFNRLHFANPEFYEGNPFEVLLAYNPTPNTHHLQRVVRSCLSRKS